MNRSDAYHRLAFSQQFELRTLKGTPMDFQHLFEDVMTRVRPGFMRVRPYGREGDWKCDGLFRKDGVFFQVYSPDEIRATELIRKITDDLAGAYERWKSEMKEWHFVYNVRNGIAPQVPHILAELQAQYPGVVLEHMSNEALWFMARELPNEDLIEILGVPLSVLAPEDEQRDGRLVIVNDAMANIDIDTAVAAMRPDVAAGVPLRLWAWNEDEQDWARASIFQEHVIREARASGLSRFAFFGLAPIPLCVHLGYVLSDRTDVRLFQFNRDLRDWAWQAADGDDPKITISGLPDGVLEHEVDVVVRVSVSFGVRREETLRAVASERPIVDMEIAVPEPSVRWLRTERQLDLLGHAFRDVLETVDRFIPRCRRIHLFYAGPVPGAVRFGQTVNPRTTPPVAVYQYDRRQEPAHQLVLTLGDRSAGSALD